MNETNEASECQCPPPYADCTHPPAAPALDVEDMEALTKAVTDGLRRSGLIRHSEMNRVTNAVLVELAIWLTDRGESR